MQILSGSYFSVWPDPEVNLHWMKSGQSQTLDLWLTPSHFDGSLERVSHALLELQSREDNWTNPSFCFFLAIDAQAVRD